MRDSFVLHSHCIRFNAPSSYHRIEMLKIHWPHFRPIIVIIFCGLLSLIKRIDHHNWEKLVEGEAKKATAHKLIFVSIIHHRLVECSPTTNAAALMSCCKWERKTVSPTTFPSSLISFPFCFKPVSLSNSWHINKWDSSVATPRDIETLQHRQETRDTHLKSQLAAREKERLRQDCH